MNRNFFIITITFLLTVNTPGQFRNELVSDLNGHKANVKSVTQFVYDYLWGKIQSEGKKRFVEEYDRRGNIVRQQIFDERQEKVLQDFRFRYDEQNRLVHSVMELALRNLTIYMRDETFYSYDVAGNITQEVYYTNGNYSGKYIYEYDDYGNQVGKLFVAPGGINNLSERKEYSYNQSGNRSEERVYYSSGELKTITRFHYDNRGNKIKELTYDARGSMIALNEWNYNHQNEIIETLSYNFSTARKEKTTRAYNNGHEVITEEYFDDDEDLIGKNIWEYESTGLIKEHVYYNFADIPEKLLTYSYEFHD